MWNCTWPLRSAENSRTGMEMSPKIGYPDQTDAAIEPSPTIEVRSSRRRTGGIRQLLLSLFLLRPSCKTGPARYFAPLFRGELLGQRSAALQATKPP
jgi:hypothetical protein